MFFTIKINDATFKCDTRESCIELLNKYNVYQKPLSNFTLRQIVFNNKKIIEKYFGEQDIKVQKELKTKEEKSVLQKLYYKLNKEKCIKYQREYHEINKEDRNKKRMARKRLKREKDRLC
jgi:hypothetical protein